MIINKEEYVPGLNREPFADSKNKAHLYKGNFADPGWPMCWRGWNRDEGTAYSIWRNNTGLGICQVCRQRAEKGLPPIPPKKDPLGETND